MGTRTAHEIKPDEESDDIGARWASVDVCRNGVAVGGGELTEHERGQPLRVGTPGHRTAR